MTGQIQQIAHAIWGQAWGNKNSFFDTTKEGQLAFKKNLLADMVKANQLAPQFLEGPFGGTLTLDEVLLLDPALTADNLARAITIQRMNQVYWSIVNYTNQHRAQYFKNDKWVLTDKVIADALQNQNLDMSWSKDAWGQPLRIVVQEKAVNNPFGQPQFQFYELTAAGPDRQIGTKDDLKLVDLQNFGRWAGATRTLTRGRTEMLGEFDNFFAFGAVAPWEVAASQTLRCVPWGRGCRPACPELRPTQHRQSRARTETGRRVKRPHSRCASSSPKRCCGSPPSSPTTRAWPTWRSTSPTPSRPGD